MLCSIDANSADGGPVSDTYGVDLLPGFVLLEPKSGGIVDRWSGFAAPRAFVARLTASASDPVTVDARRRRVEERPSVDDAEFLARFAVEEGDWKGAVDAWTLAGKLDPSRRVGHAQDILFAMAEGLDSGAFSLDQVLRQAATLRDGASTAPGALVRVARLVAGIVPKDAAREILVPYVARALDASAGTRDPETLAGRRELLVLEALYVRGDRELAASLKKETLPEGWTSDPERLNEYAWWCFEHRANLEEAEALARRGVERSAPGPGRAAILDTLAEIRNARGDPGGAAELIARAMADDPSNDRYAVQKARFESLARRPNGGAAAPTGKAAAP